MIGSLIGDIVGSIYEFGNIKTKDFKFFNSKGSYTDDSILTVATADWILNGGTVAQYYSRYGIENPWPMGGYGGGFQLWIVRSNRQGDYRPYNSCGNGSAMRVGPVGWAFNTKEEVLAKAKESAECTHNHPEGIKGAQATALCIFMARQGASKGEIREEIEKKFSYNQLWSWNIGVLLFHPRHVDHVGAAAAPDDGGDQALVLVLPRRGRNDRLLPVEIQVDTVFQHDHVACVHHRQSPQA